MDLDRLKIEKELWNLGFNNIAGLDEVGRGCLAGPLVTAAVILNKKHIEEANSETLENYKNIKDSKLISANKREKLAKFILENAFAYAIEVMSVDIVDREGIAQATQIGFFNSIGNLKTKVDHILTDAFPIKGIKNIKQLNIKKGDNLSMSIAAASIIAKVHRDKIMVEHANEFTEYEFDKHKGYGTKAHRDAIQKYGPCKLHRRSFEPVKSMFS